MNKNSLMKTLALTVSCCTALFLVSCSDVADLKEPTFKTNLDSKEVSTAAFKDLFPAQYASYMQNNESTYVSEYNGSVPYPKHDANLSEPGQAWKHSQPYLKNLWLGYPFSYEYNAARGHTYAVKDFIEIDRINRYAEKGGLPATCWNCKTPQMMPWVEKDGDAFWSKDVNEFREKIDYNKATGMSDDSIGCATCHDPATMNLRLYSVPLKDQLAEQGKTFENLSRNEQRALVCGQCHVEYYFQKPKYGKPGEEKTGVASKPVFPWANGYNPEDMYEYYMDKGDLTTPGFEGNFADWIHPVSNTPMLKAQHPEYETWQDGTHGAAGVTCADCHMAYTRTEDKQKISGHWWTSPLRDPNMTACRQCHSDKTPDYLRSRVIYTQEKTFAQLIAAQDMSVKAHEAVRLASEYTGTRHAEYDKLMIEARQMVRKGQFFWDIISAENSVGFHNPAKALDTLMASLKYSQQAVDLASQATNFAISPQLAGNIREIVKPIKEHSRLLQQDPDHLKSHPWFTYLPLLPKAEQMWEAGERIRQ